LITTKKANGLTASVGLKEKDQYKIQKTDFVIQLKRYAFLRNDFRFQEGDSLAFAELNYSVKKQKSESDPERKAV
jgi:8-oxo-dGTP diphosphatase